MKYIKKQVILGIICSLGFLSCEKVYVNESRDLDKNETPGSVLTDLVATTAAGAMTAQSVQVNVKGVRRNYTIVGTEPFSYTTWLYNWSERTEALETFDTYFTVATTGNPTPDQVDRGKHKAFQDNKCNFWRGTPLQVSTFTCGLDNNRTVTCTPKYPGQYEAKRGWTLEEVNAETISIHLTNIFIASASFLQKANTTGGWRRKYSFSLRNDDQSSRLTGLKIELLHNGQVMETRMPAHTLEDNVNWHYEANAGLFGNTAAFYAFESGIGSDRSVKSIQHGELDDFTKNDETGGTRALISSQTFSGLTLEGDYAIRISGVVKGNSFEGDKNFSIVRDLVSEGECHGETHQ